MAQTATNPDTGETLVLIGSEWRKPQQSATGDGGAKAFLVDGEWHTTEGGAAVGNPSIQRQGRGALGSVPSAAESMTKIGGAGVAGGVLGAFAPEIMTGLGAAAAAFPVTAPAAPFLFGAGSAVRGARLASGGAGALSGAVGEIAGQAVEATGAPQVAAEGARFVAGGVSPQLAVGAKEISKRVWHSQLWRTADEAGEAIAKALGKRPEDLSAQEKALIQKEIEALRGGTKKSDAPMRDVYGGLEAGAQRARTIAGDEANNLISSAEAAARQEYDAALAGPVASIRERLERLRAIGDRVGQVRAPLGQNREMADIGGELRGVIVQKNEQALAARQAQIEKDKAARDAVVSAKEKSGIVVEDLPEYKKMLGNLQSKLLNSKNARQAAKGMAEVTEPGVLAGYQRIYDAVSRRRVQTGVNAEGNPTFQEFKTSFEALDHVRRKLGEVFRGKEAEGYTALGADTARHYYAQISEIQRKFGGEPQEKLLKNYADATEGLAMFGSKGGKKVTAIDRFNEEEFLTNPSALPSNFLKSRSGIEALQNLTGDKALVSRSALEYATNQLTGKSESQVRQWMTTNREMLQSIPEVRTAVNNYADTLARSERNVARVEKMSKILSSRERSVLGDADAARTTTLATGERGAGQVRQFGEELSNRIIGDRAEIARVRQLIESGSRKEWEAAAPAILDDPKAKAGIFDAVRQVVADKAMKSPKDTGSWYAENLRPFLENQGLATKAQTDLLETRLKSIAEMKIPEEQKLTAMQRMLLQAVAGYSASLASRSGAYIRSQTQGQ